MNQTEERYPEVVIIKQLKDIETKLKKNPSKNDCKQMSDVLGQIIVNMEINLSDKEDQINKLKEEVYELQSLLQSRDDPSDKNQGILSRGMNYFQSVIYAGSGNSRQETLISSSSKPKKKVQIMDTIQTNASTKFVKTLTTTLKDFDCLINNTGKLEDEISLIVVCLKSTRLKPDVDLALENVTYSAQCVVLIVHTGAESNLPAVSSSQKLSGYPGNIEFIDIGFDVDYGSIYSCQHNARALGFLTEYVKKFG